MWRFGFMYVCYVIMYVTLECMCAMSVCMYVCVYFCNVMYVGCVMYVRYVAL